MKLGLTIFLAGCVLAQAFFSLNSFSNDKVDAKTIVACEGCK